MANKLNIVIAALDKTEAAFAKIRHNLGAVGRAVDKLKKRFPTLAAIAGKSLGGISSLFKTIAKSAGIAAVATAGIFTLLVKQSLSATDSLAKTARKIGTSTEALARMRYAAELTGVSTSTMDMALQRFTRRTAEAAKGTGEAKGALRELNIDAKAMLRLPLDEQMKELSKAFETVKTPADKVRLAMKLFDSEGVALVNTLGLGKEALEEMMGEADALGIALSGKAAQGVEDANDAFTRLKTLLKGFRDQTVAQLAPALELVTTKLVEFGKTAAGGDFEKIGETIANRIIEGFKKIVIVFQGILNVIGQTAHTIKQVYSNIFTSAETKKNELELERLKKAAFKAGLSISQALDPDSNYVERLSEANKEIVRNINRIQGELNRIKAVETEPYTPFDFSNLLAQLENVQKEIGKTTNAIVTDPPDITPINIAREAFKTWSDSIEPVDTQLQNLGTKTMDTFTNALSSAIQGTAKLSDSFKAMARSVVDSLTKMLVQYYITKPLFDLITGFGGGAAPTSAASTNTGSALTNITQKPFGSTVDMSAFKMNLNGGGFTGSGARAGGLDGKGGFPAILHPNETVIDHTKGQGMGSVVVNQTINVTTGVQQTVRAEIQNLMPQIAQSAKQAVSESAMRGGTFARSIGN